MSQREPARPHQEAEAATERQAADTRIAERPAGHRESVCDRGAVDVHPEGSAARGDPAPGGIDGDVAHESKIDDERTFSDGVSRDVVPAPSHGDRQVEVTCPSHGRGDVARRTWPDDRDRLTIDRGVEDGPCFVVAGIGGPDDLARDRIAQGVRTDVDRHRSPLPWFDGEHDG